MAIFVPWRGSSLRKWRTPRVKGHVRVYANTSAISEFLPDVLRRYLGTHPDINGPAQAGAHAGAPAAAFSRELVEMMVDDARAAAADPGPG